MRKGKFMYTKIESYLGFTENIKEPHKTRAKNTLDKLIRCDANIYEIKTWIVNKILDGWVPEVEENIITYNRQGEQNKPKTEYRLMNTMRSCYNKLNKTQYNFALYLVNKGLNNEISINKFIAEEEKRINNILLQKADEERIEKEREDTLKKERNRIQTLLNEELQNITENEKSIVDAIFLDIYGEVQDWNYSIVPLIKHFDCPYCKEEIKSRLNNDNKASFKIFECLTGLKLPRNYKERLAYLDTVNSKDFQDIRELKPRKKTITKDIHLEEVF